MPFSEADGEHMRLALRLARRGRENVSPNPMVGAVLVRSGRVVGKGYHRRFGGPHAEVEAIRDAGVGARGAHLFVTLEPCGHRGKTPPCADGVADAGVARVVYAVEDPNPLTRGRGPRRLRARGVHVERHLCRAEALAINEPYFFWHSTGRPWVLLKWAMTLDGKIATSGGESQWITGEESRRYAHRLRRRVDAVLVGTETAAADDPSLLPRPPRGRFPLRVVLDRRGRLPLSLGLLSGRRPAGAAADADGVLRANSGSVLYVTSSRSSARRRSSSAARGVHVVESPVLRGRFRLDRLLATLGHAGVSQLLVEGGGTLAGSFLSSGLVDEVAVFVAPRLAGGGRARTAIEGPGVGRLADTPWLEAPKVRRLGPDLLVEGRVRR